MKEKDLFLMVVVTALAIVVGMSLSMYVSDTSGSARYTYRVPINQDINADKITVTLSSRQVLGTVEVQQSDLYYEVKLSNPDCFVFIRYWKLNPISNVYELITQEMLNFKGEP